MADSNSGNILGNLINEGVNFGFGLFAYSRDKIEQTVQKLVDQGKVERKDAQSFTHDLIQTGEEQRAEVKKMVQEQVRSDLENLGIANNGQNQLTAADIRQIVREEIAASKDKEGTK